MMLYPAMSLLNKYVENRYLLVNVVAHRARQLSIESAEQADEEGYPLCEKPVTTAINEVAAGKLTAENIDTHIAK